MAERSEHTDGCVFNIQRYSVHDGQGIRTLVFLKGCPLRCGWCSNPESQKKYPEPAYKADMCIGCGYCLTHPENAVMSRSDSGIIRFDETKSGPVPESLAEACPAEALVVYGRRMSVQSVLDAVEQDAVFHARSGGGMTVSGGEPLFQPEFLLSLLAHARKRHIHTAMETSGLADPGLCLEAASLIGELFYDIKHLDPAAHRQHTGSDNSGILANIVMIRENFPGLPVTVRTPVVPGVNDSRECIAAIAGFVAENVPGAKYELLQYHRFGEPKYGYLGKKAPHFLPALSPQAFSELRAVAEALVPPPG